MTEGVIAGLNELIDLKRFAHSGYQPEGRALRGGGHLSRLRGRGMDFDEVRNYQAGDEVRHMEWRVTARTGKPHVKIYHEERERPVVILADFNPSMIFGTRVAFKSVVAARLASLLAWTVVKQGDRVGGFFFSADAHSELIPRGRESGVLPLLAALSRYTDQTEEQRAQPPRKLSDALIRLRRVIRPGSILVLISDFYSVDSECEKHLSRLRNHNDILAYRVCDQIELVPPKPQQYPISDGQQEMILDTGIKAVHIAYEHYCQQREDELTCLFKRLQVQWTQVTAQDDMPLLVRQTFPRRLRG